MRNLQQIKYITISITSIFIIFYEFLRHKLLIYILPSNIEIVLSSTIYLFAIFLFFQYIFKVIEELERKRQQEEREAKILFDNSIDGIYVFDSELALVAMNHGAEMMSDWKSEEIAGNMTFTNLFDIPAFQVNHFANQFYSCMKIEEGMLQKKDGSQIPISITFSKIPNERQDIIKFAAIVRDLTERKEMEKVIEGLYKEATQKQMEAETQYRIARKIISLRDLKDENQSPVLEDVVKETKKLCNVSEIALFLNDFAEDQFKLVAFSEPSNTKLMESIALLVEEQSKRSKPSESNVVIADYQISSIPLQNETATLGYLVLYRWKDIQITINQKELLKSIVNILSISFENLMFYHQLKNVAILEERGRLSREIHDGLAQIIASIHMRIEVLKSYLCCTDSVCNQEVKHLIQELGGIAAEAYTEVRQNLFNLRMPVFDTPFIVWLVEYFKQFASFNHIPVEMDSQIEQLETEMKINENTKIHVIRILQEALSNIRRHSYATKVAVSIVYDNPGQLNLIIEDNGVGFSMEKIGEQGHYGLSSMRERAKLIHGDVVIDSVQNKGTKVTIGIPMKGVS